MGSSRYWEGATIEAARGALAGSGGALRMQRHGAHLQVAGDALRMKRLGVRWRVVGGRYT